MTVSALVNAKLDSDGTDVRQLDGDGGGTDPPQAVATPWDDGGAWALVVRPGSDIASLAKALRRLPADHEFGEAFGDVETVLVYRPPDTTGPDLSREHPAPRPEDPAPAPSEQHPLARVRAVHGWSYQELARVLARRARSAGASMAAERQKVWRWEHRGVVPDRFTQHLLATELGVLPHMLVDMPWPEWLTTATTVSYGHLVAELAAEVDKGLRAVAALGYTARGEALAPTRARWQAGRHTTSSARGTSAAVARQCSRT